MNKAKRFLFPHRATNCTAEQSGHQKKLKLQCSLVNCLRWGRQDVLYLRNPQIWGGGGWRHRDRCQKSVKMFCHSLVDWRFTNNNNDKLSSIFRLNQHLTLKYNMNGGSTISDSCTPVKCCDQSSGSKVHLRPHSLIKVLMCWDK